MSWNMFSSESPDSMNARAAALNAQSDVQEALIAREIASLRDELASLRKGINYETARVLAASELIDALVQEASAIEKEGDSAIRLSEKSYSGNVDALLANATDVYLQEITGGMESLTESDKYAISHHGRFARNARRIV